MFKNNIFLTSGNCSAYDNETGQKGAIAIAMKTLMSLWFPQTRYPTLLTVV